MKLRTIHADAVDRSPQETRRAGMRTCARHLFGARGRAELQGWKAAFPLTLALSRWEREKWRCACCDPAFPDSSSSGMNSSLSQRERAGVRENAASNPNPFQNGRCPNRFALPRARSRHTRAFTLLEVLIATLIFATVIAALNAVLFAGLQLRAKTSRLIEDATPLNRAAALIRRDFQGLVPPGDGMAGQLTSGTQPTGMEEYGGLEIYTSTGITDDQLYPHGDVQKVGYFLRPATNVMDTFGKDLVRLVTRNLLATVEEWPAEQRLLNGVDRLQFYFLSGTETGWREYWDSSTEETVLPKAIKMRLEFAVDPRDPDQRKLPFELVVPILSQKRTNATENAESTGETETPGGGGNNNTGGNNPPAGNNTSGGAAGGGAPGGAGGGGGGGGGGGQRGGAPR